MKKRLIIFIIFSLFTVIFGISYEPQITIEEHPDAYKVIEYMDNELDKYPDDSNNYYLLFDSFKLDSNNFVSVLSFFDNYDYKIVEVYPYINPMYQTILKNVSIIMYKGNTLGEGIGYVYSTYLKEIENNHLSEELDKTLINGIRIRMIKMSVNNSTLNSFLKKYNNIKYNLLPYGLFKYNEV